MLVEVDPKGAVATLQKLIPHCPVFLYPRDDWDVSGGGQDLAALADALARLGDDSGLDIYAKWLARQKFDEIHDGMPRILAPLGRYPDRPSIREVSAKLFQNGCAGWLNAAVNGEDLLQTRLIRNEAFRDLVLQSLKNGEKCGGVVVKKGGQFEATESGETFGGVAQSDLLAPKAGEQISFRVCDDMAWRLSRIKNLPHFELYWPQTDRDAAIVAITEFLKEHGNHLELKPQSWFAGAPDDG